ncbi:hypothetical protein NHX12_006461 [Muraenolepis orangiensis]|uniref:WH2 domain-containing protein n=1 Tax=Muraenolepis orangiensis TaxID=630683 RepID=A0A9Q0ICW3_9TELE|nr:hypothetical protein NHX12_006461 [Muraenolepis orangiensis]
MVLLLEIYQEEDQAYQDLVTTATVFFQYLLQPFRDMRELACLYKMEILKLLDYEELGPKRMSALENEAEEWRRRAEEAISSIQDITVRYFIQTSKALAGMVKQMEEDKGRFGASAWASATPRLEKLRFLLAKETLQHMRASEMCLNRKKNSIRGRALGGVSPGDQPQQESVDQLELLFYEAQLELYDTKFEILKNEEQLLMAQIDTLRRQIKELNEEVVYYDVCEDQEELQSLVQTGLQHTDSSSSSARQLKRRLMKLETKRGSICSRRDQCVEANRHKECAAEHSSMLFSQHHHVHLKRELRSFREKRQGHYVLKTPHSKMATAEPLCPDSSQPMSFISLDPTPPLPPPSKTPKKKPPAVPHAASPDTPMPLSVKEAPPFPAKNTLKQNIGTMDEVMASLQRGRIQLRKVPALGTGPPPGNPRDGLMTAIRHGVTLKKVVRQPTAEHDDSQDNDLERSIKAAMRRMKKVSADSDEDSDEDEMHNSDWDS